MKDPPIPETGTARYIPDVAVVLELVGLDKVAWCQSATAAGRVLKRKCFPAESLELIAVPDLDDVSFGQVPENLLLHGLVPAAQYCDGKMDITDDDVHFSVSLCDR